MIQETTPLYEKVDVINEYQDTLESHIIPNDNSSMHIVDATRCWCEPEIVGKRYDGVVLFLHRMKH